MINPLRKGIQTNNIQWLVSHRLTFQQCFMPLNRRKADKEIQLNYTQWLLIKQPELNNVLSAITFKYINEAKPQTKN